MEGRFRQGQDWRAGDRRIGTIAVYVDNSGLQCPRRRLTRSSKTCIYLSRAIWDHVTFQHGESPVSIECNYGRIDPYCFATVKMVDLNSVSPSLDRGKTQLLYSYRTVTDQTYNRSSLNSLCLFYYITKLPRILPSAHSAFSWYLTNMVQQVLLSYLIHAFSVEEMWSLDLLWLYRCHQAQTNMLTSYL